MILIIVFFYIFRFIYFIFSNMFSSFLKLIGPLIEKEDIK